MPNSKVQRRGHEAGKDQNRRGRVTEKASSFQSRSPAVMEKSKQLPRPRTAPDLRSAVFFLQSSSAVEESPRLLKLLLNVNIQGSVGPVQVVMTPDSTVGDLISAAVRQYVKEGRRPMLRTADTSGCDLHYSQFSLESLGRDEKLMSLGSRNFFLCQRRPTRAGRVAIPAGSCYTEAEKATKAGFNWLKFMGFSP